MVMRDFHRNFDCRSCGCDDKRCKFKNCSSPEKCKCFAPVIKFHHCNCPIVRKLCPIHGSRVHSDKKPNEIDGETDQSVENSFRSNLKTDKLLKSIKQLYSAHELNKERYKNRRIQTDFEESKNVFGSCHFVEKTKSFFVEKTNKMKKIKQCFHSPCNSVTRKSRSHTSVGEKKVAEVPDEVVYGNKNWKKFEYSKKMKGPYHGIPEPNLQRIFKSDVNLSDDDKSSGRKKMDSDFEEKNGNIFERKTSTFELKKKPGHFMPYIAYPIMTKSESKKKNLTQSEDELKNALDVERDNIKKTSDFEQPEKNRKNKNIEKLSSETSGSLYFTPYIFMQTEMRNLNDDDKSLHLTSLDLVDEELTLANKGIQSSGFPLNKKTQTSFPSTEDNSSSLLNGSCCDEDKVCDEEEIIIFKDAFKNKAASLGVELREKVNSLAQLKIGEGGTQMEPSLDENENSRGPNNEYANQPTSYKSKFTENSEVEPEKERHRSIGGKTYTRRLSETQVSNRLTVEEIDRVLEDLEKQNFDKKNGILTNSEDVLRSSEAYSRNSDFTEMDNIPLSFKTGRNQVTNSNYKSRAHKQVQTPPLAGNPEFLDVRCTNSSNVTFIIQSVLGYDAANFIKSITEHYGRGADQTQEVTPRNLKIKENSGVANKTPKAEIENKKNSPSQKLVLKEPVETVNAQGFKDDGDFLNSNAENPVESEVAPVKEINDSSFSDLTDLIKLINLRFDKMETGQSHESQPLVRPSETLDTETMTDALELYQETNFPSSQTKNPTAHAAVQTIIFISKEQITMTGPEIAKRSVRGENQKKPLKSPVTEQRPSPKYEAPKGASTPEGNRSLEVTTDLQNVPAKASRATSTQSPQKSKPVDEKPVPENQCLCPSIVPRKNVKNSNNILVSFRNTEKYSVATPSPRVDVPSTNNQVMPYSMNQSTVISVRCSRPPVSTKYTQPVGSSEKSKNCLPEASSTERGNRPSTSATQKPPSKRMVYSVMATSKFTKEMMQSLKGKPARKSKNSHSTLFPSIRQKRSHESDKDRMDVKKIKNDTYEDLTVFDLEDKTLSDCFIFGKTNPAACYSKFKFVMKKSKEPIGKRKNFSLTKDSGFVWIPSFSEHQFSFSENHFVSQFEKATKSAEGFLEKNKIKNFDWKNCCDFFASRATSQRRSTGTLNLFDVDKQNPKPFKCSFCKSLTYLKPDGSDIFEGNESKLLNLKAFLTGKSVESEFRSVTANGSVFAYPAVQTTPSNLNPDRNQFPSACGCSKMANKEFLTNCSPENISFSKSSEEPVNASREVDEFSGFRFSFTKLMGMPDAQMAPALQSLFTFQAGKKLFDGDAALKKSKSLRASMFQVWRKKNENKGKKGETEESRDEQ